MTIICLPIPNFLCAPRFRTGRYFFLNGECEVTWYISRHQCMKWIVHILRDKTSAFTSLYLKHLNMCISNNMLRKRTVLCWATSVMQWVVHHLFHSRSLKSRMLLILLNLTVPCHILPVISRPLLEKCVLDCLIEYLINYVLNKCVFNFKMFLERGLHQISVFCKWNYIYVKLQNFEEHDIQKTVL